MSESKQEFDILSATEDVTKRIGDLRRKLNDDTREQIELRSLENRMSGEILKVAKKYNIDLNETLDLQSQLNKLKEGGGDGPEKTNLTALVNAKQEEFDLEKQIIGQKAISSEISNIISQIEKNTVSEGKKYVSLIDKMITRKGALVKTTELFVFLLKQGLEIFVAFETAAEKFRIQTGFTISQTKETRKQAEQLTLQFQRFGVDIEKSNESIGAIINTFSGLQLQTDETSKTAALLAANFGVAAENTALVLSRFQGLGGATQDVSTNTIRAAASISKAAGVPFAKVMEDVAKASDDVLLTVGATPEKLMAASIQARALGIDLNTAASAARRLLDFNTSINDELNASALLGRSVNFQRARQLAYDENIVGATKEIVRQVKMAGDFNKMSVFQREALAKAAGLELSALNKLMAVENIRQRGTEDQRNRLRALDDQMERMEKLKKETAESILLEREMQSVMTNLNNAFKQLGVALGGILSPALVQISGGLEKVAEVMGDVISYVSKMDEGEKLFLGWTIIIAALGVAIFGLYKTFAGLIAIKKTVAATLTAVATATTAQTTATAAHTAAINTNTAAASANAAATATSGTAVRGAAVSFGGLAASIKPVLIGVAAVIAIAAGIAALGASLIVLGKGFKSVGEGVKDIDALNLLKVGGAIALMVGSLVGMGVLAVAGVAGLIVLTGSLWLIGRTVKGLDAEKFEKIGTSISSIFNAFTNVPSASAGRDFMKSLSELSISDDVINKLDSLASLSMRSLSELSISDDVINKLGSLASLSDGLMQTAIAMERLSNAVSTLSEVNYDNISTGVINRMAGTTANDSAAAVNMDPVVTAINNLRNDLLDGNIAVYLDGVNVSRTLSRVSK